MRVARSVLVACGLLWSCDSNGNPGFLEPDSILSVNGPASFTVRMVRPKVLVSGRVFKADGSPVGEDDGKFGISLRPVEMESAFRPGAPFENYYPWLLDSHIYDSIVSCVQGRAATRGPDEFSRLVPAGQYVLTASGFTKTASGGGAPANRVLENSGRQVVEAAIDTVADIALPGALLLLGMVTYPDGSPAASADVQVLPESILLPSSRTRTDDEGSFMLALPSGRYRILAIPPEKPAALSTSTLTRFFDLRQDSSLILSLETGESLTVTMKNDAPDVYRRGKWTLFSRSDLLWADGVIWPLSVELSEFNFAPDPRWTQRISAENEEPAPSTTLSVQVPAGTYDAVLLPDGAGSVSLEVDFPAQWLGSLRVTGEMDTEIQHRGVGGIRLAVFERGNGNDAALFSEPTRTGRDAKVLLYPSDNEYFDLGRSYTGHILNFWIDASGSEIGNIPEGRYLVVACPDCYGGSGFFGPEISEARVRAGSTTRLEMELPRKHEIRLTVLDPEGRPMGDTGVLIVPEVRDGSAAAHAVAALMAYSKPTNNRGEIEVSLEDGRHRLYIGTPSGVPGGCDRYRW